MKSTISLLVSAFLCCGAYADNRALPANVYAQTTVEASTHLTIYKYSVSAPSTNDSPLDTLTIKLPPGADVLTGISSPTGWRAFYSAEQGRIMWAATGYLQPNNSDETGNVPPSDFAIAPGTTLNGFSFKSFGPPGNVTAYVQAYRPIPSLTDDFNEEVAETDLRKSTLPEDNGLMITSIGPQPAVLWDGNRRPSVDGFLVFVNVSPRSSFQGSALIVFRLGSSGEQVNASTLRVDLNGVDVTGTFVYLEEFLGYAAVFDPSSSPIKYGNNVLKTSVEGVIPGSIHLATDSDRLAFTLTP